MICPTTSSPRVKSTPASATHTQMEVAAMRGQRVVWVCFGSRIECRSSVLTCQSGMDGQ